jgi:uncharacterized protein (TIGR03905 family)
MYNYKTSGVCCKNVNFDIRDGKLYSVSFERGCNGNLKSIGALIEGMDAAEVVKRLKGICCDDKGTSCGDQLAKAIEQYL